jgi:hypothetical protein
MQCNDPPPQKSKVREEREESLILPEYGLNSHLCFRLLTKDFSGNGGGEAVAGNEVRVRVRDQNPKF